MVHSYFIVVHINYTIYNIHNIYICIRIYLLLLSLSIIIIIYIIIIIKPHRARDRSLCEVVNYYRGWWWPYKLKSFARRPCMFMIFITIIYRHPGERNICINYAMSPDGNLRVDVCHVFDFGNTRTYNITIFLIYVYKTKLNNIFLHLVFIVYYYHSKSNNVPVAIK